MASIFDGVVSDFDGAFRALCREMFGKPAHNDGPSDWEWSNYGLTSSEKEAVWDRIGSSKNWWLRLEPLPDTEELRGCQWDDWYEPIFITSRVPTLGASVARQSAEWLEMHYRIDLPTVLVASNKGELANALQLDAFIDDKPENCLDVLHWMYPRGEVFLQDASHNVAFATPTGIHRASSLNNFLRRVKQL